MVQTTNQTNRKVTKVSEITFFGFFFIYPEIKSTKPTYNNSGIPIEIIS